MKLYIFTTNKDLSAPIISDEAKNQKLVTEILLYENLKISEGQLTNSGSILTFLNDDKIIIRWPWDADDTSIEYNSIVKYLCGKFQENIFSHFGF